MLYLTDMDAENEGLEPSLKALEAAAERLEMLKISESNTDKSKLSRMTTEYYMLRIYLVRTLKPCFSTGIIGAG